MNPESLETYDDATMKLAIKFFPEMLKTMKANAGWLPWNPDKLKTIDPVDLTNLRVMSNGDRQITRADSKAAGQIIPKRFFDTDEGARFFGGTPTNRYDILHEARK